MRVLVAALFAIALAGQASAQMGGKGKGGKRGGEPRETADVYHVVLEELRIDLKLTAVQQPLFDAYVGKIEALKNDIARQRRAKPSQADAPRELDRMVDSQRDRLTAMEDVAEAGKIFYKSLNEEQKALADARLARLVAASLEAPAAKPAPR